MRVAAGLRREMSTEQAVAIVQLPAISQFRMQERSVVFQSHVKMRRKN